MAKTMTATAFRAALDKLNMTQVGAATYFGVNDRTVRRWIAGDQPIPRAVALQIETLLKARRA